MNRTNLIKEDLNKLGKKLGFHCAEEIDKTFLSIYLSESYTPRVNFVWYLDLEDYNIDVAALSDYLRLEEKESLRKFPFFGFEIESSAGKHAAGGIINLAKHSTISYVLVRTQQDKKRIERKLGTYGKVLGIRNIKAMVF